MSDKGFDDIIKKKLETLRAEYAPESWDALSSKMALDPELSDGYSDDSFDETIRSQLDSIKAEYFPETWNDLAAKMELNSLEEEVIDDYFDNSVQSKLKEYSIPLSDNSWEVLKERMEHESYLRTQLYIAKATEVVIIFLLLFTVFRLLPPTNTVERSPNIEFAKVELENANLSEEENTAEMPGFSEDSQLQEKTTQSIAGIGPSSNNSTIAGANLDNVGKGGIDQFKTVGESLQTTNFRIDYYPSIEKISSNINQSPSYLAITKKLNDLVISEDINNGTNLIQNQLINFASLDALETLSSTGVENDSEFLNDEIQLLALDKKARTKVWLNGFLSADAMLINTPYDPVYDAPAFNKAAAGFSGGFSVSAQRGSIELDAGLSYSSKGYQPQIIRELNGSLEANYVERALTNIIFDMAQANFNIKHHFYKNKKLQLYVMAGSTFNLITYSEYNFEEKPRSGNGVPLLTPIQTKLLDQKNFEDGALEGGGLISNSFFTLNVGLGLQHNISSKLAIFFQPNYQRHILDGGIGPNNDRIHNLSLQVGTKVLLN